MDGKKEMNRSLQTLPMNDTFPQELKSQHERGEQLCSAHCQGKTYWAVVTTETRMQTTPSTRKHRVENWTLVTIINLRFWSLWLGKGTGEERRQTLAVCPGTALAPLTEATGVKVPWAEALLFIWGAGRIQNPSRSYGWSSKSKDRGNVYSISGAPQPWVKDPCLGGKGDLALALTLFNQLSSQDRF